MGSDLTPEMALGNLVAAAKMYKGSWDEHELLQKSAQVLYKKLAEKDIKVPSEVHLPEVVNG
jgi:hypothetical protein